MLELAIFSTLLKILAKAENYIRGGTPHRKKVYWEGGTPHILS